MKQIPKKYFKDVPTEIQREEKPHYVYFILAKEGNLKRVKIGKCDKEEGIIKRFSSLNTSSPIDLKIIGYLKGYEKDWHRYFKEHRIKGEWFDFECTGSFPDWLSEMVDWDVANVWWDR